MKKFPTQLALVCGLLLKLFTRGVVTPLDLQRRFLSSRAFRAFRIWLTMSICKRSARTLYEAPSFMTRQRTPQTTSRTPHNAP